MKNCLGLDIPFGSRHLYMGTHNHRLQLGDSVYLEIVALDPDGISPGRPRWFGLDDKEKITADWEAGRRLRGWVANTEEMETVLATQSAIFGERVSLPTAEPDFAFAIPQDGSLPLDGAAPSIIDHWGDARYIATIPDLGARLLSFTLEHPNPSAITALYNALAIARAPTVVVGPELRYRALIETPAGVRELT